MKCQRCSSDRIAEVNAKCSDCCGVSIAKYNDGGYVPDDMGIGGGDYVEFRWCMECGQIQGTWPLDKCKAEKFNPNACKQCDWDTFNEVGECDNCGHHKEMWCPRCENLSPIYRHRGSLARCNVSGYKCVFPIEELKRFNEGLE